MDNMNTNVHRLTIGALLTAVFAVTAIAFKSFVLIPGITEIRICNAFPVPFGMLFGGTGALAVGLGNLLADLVGGTLTPGSIGGFVGNFAMAWIPYKLWNSRQLEHEDFLNPKGPGRILLLWFYTFVSSAACAIIIGFTCDVFSLVPFTVLFPLILINDTIAGIIFGTIIYLILYKQVIHTPALAAIGKRTEPWTGKSGSALTMITVISLLLSLFMTAVGPKVTGDTETLIVGAFSTIMLLIGMKLK
jgi:hypothetical protein